MRKKMLMIGIVVVVIIVFVFGGWYIAFTRFGVGPAFPFLAVKKLDESQVEMLEVAENQLMALVDTEEQAQEIAAQYGIEFVSFENGLALYHTEEDPFEVITRGQENGYPQISVNFVRSGYDTDEVQ
ncbi:MAG: hypothetical protein K1W31_02080 [Lachnospiraceae bacterium]|jgi:Na+/serine symporter